MNKLNLENSLLKVQMNELINQLNRFELSQNLILEKFLKLEKGFFLSFFTYYKYKTFKLLDKFCVTSEQISLKTNNSFIPTEKSKKLVSVSSNLKNQTQFLLESLALPISALDICNNSKNDDNGIFFILIINKNLTFLIINLTKYLAKTLQTNSNAKSLTNNPLIFLESRLSFVFKNFL